MVLVVRSDLKMGKGKVAAQVSGHAIPPPPPPPPPRQAPLMNTLFIQCAHAAVGAYKQMLRRDMRVGAFDDYDH